MQLVLVDRDRHSRGKERLGHRPDLEDGPGAHRRPALAADAEAFGVNQLVAGDDTDRKAGYIEALHIGRDIVLQAWGERLDLLLNRWVGNRMPSSILPR